MDTHFIKGIIVPILMPILPSEDIDEAKLRRQVDFVIEGGVSGILLCGSNGEFYAMEEDDIRRATQIVVDAAKGRVPIFLGIGSITTRSCVRTAKMARENGVQGVSLLQPMFIAPSEDELYAHYRTVAQAVPDLPLLIYNNPRVGYGISPRLGVRLAADVENIVGVKDSSGNMSTLEEYVRLSQNMDFHVLAGKDTMIFPCLAAGAVGAVATTANFVPKLVVDIYRKYLAGDYAGAREAQYKLTPVRNALDLASFPVGTKDIANLMGMDVGAPYLPNKSTTGEKLEKMRAILKENGLIR